MDPATGVLWADQELVGLWKVTTDLGLVPASPTITRYGQTWSVSNGKCVVNDSSTGYGDAYLPADLEGIGLYRAGLGSGGYLFFMSNQNSSLFTVSTVTAAPAGARSRWAAPAPSTGSTRPMASRSSTSPSVLASRPGWSSPRKARTLPRAGRTSSSRHGRRLPRRWASDRNSRPDGGRPLRCGPSSRAASSSGRAGDFSSEGAGFETLAAHRSTGHQVINVETVGHTLVTSGN